MRISRLYISNSLNTSQTIELKPEAAHYVRTVLRLKKSNQLIVFNGLGDEYLSMIDEVSRKRVVINIVEKKSRCIESPLNIHLGLGISRGDRMDWAVQKSVELGVNCITPLITERCVVKFKADKKQQRQQHWQHIVQHATEQSGRTILAELTPIQSLESWVNIPQGLSVFLDPTAEKSLKDLPENINKITLMAGPEGGFSATERLLSINAGFIPIRLGQRILRTETAALSALSAVQMLWGDFS